jgi:hypothetical protein
MSELKVYLPADIKLKQKALAKTASVDASNRMTASWTS